MRAGSTSRITPGAPRRRAVARSMPAYDVTDSMYDVTGGGAHHAPGSAKNTACGGRPQSVSAAVSVTTPPPAAAQNEPFCRPRPEPRHGGCHLHHAGQSRGHPQVSPEVIHRSVQRSPTGQSRGHPQVSPEVTHGSVQRSPTGQLNRVR